MRFPCDLCDFKATQKASLLRHLASIHKSVKYQCDHKATLKGDLWKHVKSKHEGHDGIQAISNSKIRKKILSPETFMTPSWGHGMMI